MLDRDTVVEGLVLALMAAGLLAVGLVITLSVRILKRAERGERRRYVLAGLMVVGAPLFFVGVARSLAWLYRMFDGSMFGPDEDWLLLANLLPAMACSASAAFALPSRGPRERGFAIFGGAVMGFAVYLFSLSP